MKIEDVAVDRLIPYENNPRFNDDAVQYVADSIKEFGFKVPLVIDKNNVVVTGHTRLKAAKQLGLETVPCIRADDLTEEQVKAFRIADNKVGEIADWDFTKLELELNEIDIDMSDFGINMDDFRPTFEEEEEGWYGDERERTYKSTNLDLVDESNLTNDFWQMPIIKCDDYIPEEMVVFHHMHEQPCRDTVHFYTDDYRFERLWNLPSRYQNYFDEYKAMLTPDFSIYVQMPMPVKIWNIYRSRFLGAYFQSLGYKVIPSVEWCEPETYEFAFQGIPKGSIVAVSPVSMKKDPELQQVWIDGFEEMVRRIEPKKILVYDPAGFNYDYMRQDVKFYTNDALKVWRTDRKPWDAADIEDTDS